MKMNLPNMITLFRVFLVPFFVVFMLNDSIPANYILACVVFVVACISDFFDGYLARKYNLVSNFGKFADPLADKLLVGAALICFVQLQLMPAWMVIVIISREFIISGVRLIAADEGIVIAASMWGKVKTCVQMAMSIFLILWPWIQTKITVCAMHSVGLAIGALLKYAAVILTVVSLIDYMYKSREIFTEKK